MLATFLNLPLGVQIALVVFTIGIANGVIRTFTTWGNAISAPAKTLSITLKTDKTPQEITEAAAAARFKRRLAVFAAFAGLWFYGAWRRPDIFVPLTRSLGDLFVGFLEFLGRVLLQIGSQLGEVF